MIILKNKRNKEEILFKTVKEDNILPITSICKLNCIFCSHKNNPPEVETYSYGHLKKEVIETMIEFLDPKQPVFIGESASKIIEGEPFIHPDIYEILEYLRQRWPEIEIKITSSGAFLEVERLKTLEKLQPLNLNISLNGPVPEDRVFLMNDSRPQNVFKVIKNLKKYNLEFEASIVSMHHLKGFKYLKKTFDFLEEYHPKSLRVFMPGFSNHAEEKLLIDQSEYYKLKEFIDLEKDNYSYPIIIEPQLISNLKAEINGVMENSPAAAAELKSGDQIYKVDREKVESRVDAFYKIKKAKNPKIEFYRSAQKLRATIKKEKKESSGLIMSYDLSLNEINKVKRFAAESRREKNNLSTVILSSQLAYPFFKNFLKEYLNNQYNFELYKVENKFFGGSIIAAGLLINKDLIFVLNQIDKEIDRILLPKIIYDYYGNDLLGNHYTELEYKYDSEVVLI